jgi:hypothetical protein
MKEFTPTTRKKLKNKMAQALDDTIKDLSVGMQDILLDDLVTAFENRLAVLNQAQSNSQYFIDVGVKIQNETL